MTRIFITYDNKIIKDNFNNLPMGRDILNKNIWFYDDKIIHYTRKLLFDIKKKMINIFFKDVYKKEIELIENIIDKDISNKYRFYYL